MKNFIILLAFLCQSSILFGQVWTGSTLGGDTYRNGRVGIGTSTLRNPLEIGSGYSIHDGGHKVIGLGYAPGAGNYAKLNGYPAEIRYNPEGQLSLGISSTYNATGASISGMYHEMLVLNKNGNVGIGYSVPSSKLHVNGNIRAKSSIEVEKGGVYRVALNGNTDGYIVGRDDNSDTKFFITSSGRSYLNGGDVGIGTNAPSAKLDVRGKINSEKFQIRTPSAGSWFNITSVDGSNRFDINRAYNGDIPLMSILASGRVGIGTTNPDAPLTVAGNIHAREIKVTATAGGADFVFADDYTLPQLHEVEAFVKKNKHLPEIPSAAEMEANGLHLAEMNIKLLQKVEELTLYAIEQEKKMEEQLKQKDEEIAAILKRINQLEASK